MHILHDICLPLSVFASLYLGIGLYVVEPITLYILLTVCFFVYTSFSISPCLLMSILLASYLIPLPYIVTTSLCRSNSFTLCLYLGFSPYL